MKIMSEKPISKHPDESCIRVPDLKRLNYFYGQMLGVDDFRAEQNYFREKLRLHNRCLHGYGVVCGLKVVPEPLAEECESEEDRARRAQWARCKVLEQEIEECRKQAEAAESEEKKAVMLRRCEQLEQEYEKICRDICEPAAQTNRWPRVLIECGMGLDCEGNELIVRHPLPVDLWGMLTKKERNTLQASKFSASIYVSLCFCEQLSDPIRPVLPDICGVAPECTYGKLRDAVRIKVGLASPLAEEHCETCCSPCDDTCLLLARIDGLQPGVTLKEENIHNEVRRDIALYTPSRIKGISWTHGGTYSGFRDGDAVKILGTFANADKEGGFEIRFSKDVQTETLVSGVVDIWVIEGGKGRQGNVYHREGEFVGLDRTKPLVDRFRYRDTTGESLNRGDRVILVVNTDFILDECCQPVDGNHIGGLVPILPGYEAFDQSPLLQTCRVPPRGFGPWMSGNGTPGGNFVSWFFVDIDSTQHGESHDKRAPEY